MMILNDPEIASFVCGFKGVEAFVDLEVLGKADRQGHMASWKSKQVIEDVTTIRMSVPDSHLIVRINPLNEGSEKEINEVISRGADSVMLPMFQDEETLSRFLDLLKGRVNPLPLFETAASVASLPSMVATLGIQRLHIGLNDLHLDLNQNFIFQPIAEGYLDKPTQYLRDNKIEFGIGGIARANEGIISPQFILGEYVRLGSSSAILSQTFHRNATTLYELCQEMDFEKELIKLQDIHNQCSQYSNDQFEENRVITRDHILRAIKAIK